MKKLFSIITALFLIIGSGSTLVSADGGFVDSNGLTSEQKQIMIDQAEAMEIGVFIKENFDEDQYGGMYIDNDHILNVFLLDNEEVKEYIKDKNVITHEAKYSFEELISAVEEATAYAEKYHVDYAAIALDESMNAIQVDLGYRHLMTPVAFGIQSDLFDLDIFQVSYTRDTQIDLKEEATYTLRPGHKLSTSAGSFSYAFGAKDSSGNVGFVTAGHCGSVNTAVLSQSVGVGKKLGTITKSYNNATGDSAFIKRATQVVTYWNPGKTTAYSGNKLDGAGSGHLIQGAACNLEGMVSKHKTGTITSLATSISGKTRVVASYSSTNGDSGGCVWVGRYITNTNVFARMVVGVHNGSYSVNGVRKGAYFTGINKVMSQLGITYYAV